MGLFFNERIGVSNMGFYFKGDQCKKYIVFNKYTGFIGCVLPLGKDCPKKRNCGILDWECLVPNELVSLHSRR